MDMLVYVVIIIVKINLDSFLVVGQNENHVIGWKNWSATWVVTGEFYIF